MSAAGYVSDESISTISRIAYDKVTERYQDVLILEASTAELHQLFMDFALLTEQQGEYLDQIEYHVKSAGDNVEEGNLKIHKALRYLKKIQKKRMLLWYVNHVGVGCRFRALGLTLLLSSPLLVYSLIVVVIIGPIVVVVMLAAASA